MGPVATIAYQTRYGEQARQERLGETTSDDKSSQTGEKRFSSLANSCVAYAIDED